MNDEYKCILNISNGLIRHHNIPDDIMPFFFEYLGDIKVKIPNEDVMDYFEIIKKPWSYNHDKFSYRNQCKNCKKDYDCDFEEPLRFIKTLRRHILSNTCQTKRRNRIQQEYEYESYYKKKEKEKEEEERKKHFDPEGKYDE